MQVLIQQTPIEIKITSVFLDANPGTTEDVHLFKCFQCGNNLVQYFGDVVRIMPGLAPVALPIIAGCRICKRKYQFVSIVSSTTGG